MSRRSLWFFALPCPLLLAALAATPAMAQQDEVYETEEHAYRVVAVAEGLESPWSIAFLPDGDILVTEQPGRLRILRDGVLLPQPVAGVPAVRFQGQGGLMDVVPHPAFESNRLLYLSYSKPNDDGSEGTTAVIRGRFEGDQLLDVEEIFEAVAWSGTSAHFGSRLAFDADGYLFITVGDRGATPFAEPRESHPAQLLTNHQGTVIRLHDDGRVPDDNPFVDRADALPEIWSYGHRNPQGLAIDPETGNVWVIEHGPQGGDELNLVLPGRNYGWPVIGYGVQYGGETIHESRQREGMEQPVQFWVPSIATSSLMIYNGDRFPEWRGDLFVGSLDGQQIARVSLSEADDGYEVGRMERPALFFGFGRVRDVRQSPDGDIYVAIDDRRGGGVTPILRLEPVASPLGSARE